MKTVIGIRREDKNKWERRVPLIPEHVRILKDQSGIETIIQPSGLRIYGDDKYTAAGGRIDEDLSDADTIFAVKEIPIDFLDYGKTYIFFSHTIKGQPYNMEMLKRLMALKCHLIDYERIINEKDQRLIFFGAHAGYAGMIETLHAYSRKMNLKGVVSPLDQIKQAYEYESLEAAKLHIGEIGQQIADIGLPQVLCPLIVGFTGYGNVSRGAQEIIDLLPVKTVTPEDVTRSDADWATEHHHLFKVVFKEVDMVRPLAGKFELQDYYDHPEKYESIMETYLPFLKILVNGIYWTNRYPRIVTKGFLTEAANHNRRQDLEVIGDISCDIEGAIEITYTATMPDTPCFTYLPQSDRFEEGIATAGITVMAVDNLPCEFPKESSEAFSNVLKKYVKIIALADFSVDFASLDLPYPIKKALILHNGEFTDEYKYMQKVI